MVSKRIVVLREAKGLSQAALAKKAGLSQSKLSRIEDGKQGIMWDDICALADALDITTDELRIEEEFRAVLARLLSQRYGLPVTIGFNQPNDRELISV